MPRRRVLQAKEEKEVREKTDTNSQSYPAFGSQVQPDTHDVPHLQPDQSLIPLVTHYSLAGEAESVRYAKSDPSLLEEVFNLRDHNRTAT